MPTLNEKIKAKELHSMTFFVPSTNSSDPSSIFAPGNDSSVFVPGGSAMSQIYFPGSAPITNGNGYIDPTNTSVGTQPKNTWYDWHLAPASRPSINPPKVNTKYIEVPGFNGYLDLTNALTANILGPREGSIQFYALNDYAYWDYTYNQILEYVHGSKLRVVLDDMPKYYYEGRWTVEEWVNYTDGKASGGVTFKYYLNPERKLIS